MLLNDIGIKNRSLDHLEEPMISPFIEGQMSSVKDKSLREIGVILKDRKVISFGLSSAGYDMRLSKRDVRIFGHNGTEAIDPKNFNGKPLYSPGIMTSKDGDYVLVPPKTYGLGVSMEHFIIPNNVLAICVGKSTLARCGMFINTTPLEPGWSGHLTVEFFNANNAPFKLYLEEGVAQCLFFETHPVGISYSDRGGKYQEQPEEVVLPRMK